MTPCGKVVACRVLCVCPQALVDRHVDFVLRVPGAAVAHLARPHSLSITIEECEYHEAEDTFSVDCRCGGAYVVTGAELDAGACVVQCTSCSLHAKISDAGVTPEPS